jgi:hypothetical protein
MRNVVIRFESERDRWHAEAQQGDGSLVSVDVPLEEMIAEYYRWLQSGAAGEWRAHAEQYLTLRLQTSQPVGNGNNHLLP